MVTSVSLAAGGFLSMSTTNIEPPQDEQRGNMVRSLAGSLAGSLDDTRSGHAHSSTTAYGR